MPKIKPRDVKSHAKIKFEEDSQKQGFSIGQGLGVACAFEPISDEELEKRKAVYQPNRIEFEQKDERNNRQSMKEYLTKYFNEIIDFISEDATAEQLRRIEVATKKKIKEINKQAEYDGVRKYLTLAKQRSGNILVLEHFNGTSRSLSLDELKNLNLSEYNYSAKVQDHLDSILK